MLLLQLARSIVMTAAGRSIRNAVVCTRTGLEIIIVPKRFCGVCVLRQFLYETSAVCE